jgi:hypothetical protein
MEKYEELIIEIIEFHDEDIVTVSNPDAQTDDEIITP